MDTIIHHGFGIDLGNIRWPDDLDFDDIQAYIETKNAEGTLPNSNYITVIPNGMALNFELLMLIPDQPTVTSPDRINLPTITPTTAVVLIANYICDILVEAGMLPKGLNTDFNFALQKEIKNYTAFSPYDVEWTSYQ